MPGWRFLQWIFKKSLEAEIRKEITSGDEASAELVNVILKAIRDKFPITIQQDADGATYIVIKTDNVGLAKSTDISATQPRDITDRVARILGQITDGTGAVSPSAFGSATHPRNILQWAGTALTGRDISADLAKLNVELDTRASEVSLAEIGSLIALGSTTTALAADASWTSLVDNALNTGRIVGSVFADQAGTLYIEQSPDNTNWDIVDSFSVSANAGLGFSVEKVVQYTRVRYVNSTVAQTAFRLYIWKRLRIR